MLPRANTLRSARPLALGLFVLLLVLTAMPAAAQERFGLRFTRADSGLLVPQVSSASAVVFDPVSGEVLWESGGDDRRSIASLTKMMTALVYLESGPDLFSEVVIADSDVRRSFNYWLRAGDRVTVADLLHMLLIPSDNAAARALARTSVYGTVGFIDAMNRTAQALGLTATTYADPSGLDRNNVSTAYDMARLVSHVSAHPTIARIMRLSQYTARPGGRAVTVRSTNQLVRGGDYDVVAGKTGYIRQAGHCLATLLRLPESGEQVAVVVLGAPTSAVRFREVRGLYAWVQEQARGLFVAQRYLD
jgi:D-alanyl-D-alanine endopeptidase (penicillin-binding protein 7)